MATEARRDGDGGSESEAQHPQGNILNSAPLGGLVVVDLATLGAAPQIAAFFGDMGARVVKVEPPRGDGLRQLVDRRGTALQWQLVNRNKECISLDVAKTAGRAVLERLLERADLLVSNLSRERLARWDLGAESLARRHPRLVAVNLTAYGVTGPWAERPGSGTLAEATSGLAALTGPADREPTLSPVGLGDYVGVLQGIIAALLGLYGRRGDGAPTAFFDVSMVQPLLGLLSHRIATAVRDGAEPGRHGNRFPNVAPRNTYRAANGVWVALTAGTDEMVRRLFTAIGRPDLATDARFRDNLARLANVESLDAAIGEWIGGRTAADAVEQLADAGVSAAVCDSLLGVGGNPHFHARGEIITHGEGEAALTVAAPLAPGQIRWLGRERGADNHAVYRQWLGLSQAELDELRRAGVV